MNDLGHTHSFVVDPPLPRRHHREVVNRQRAHAVDRDRPVEHGPGYGHTVVSSDGGWSAADLRARWSRQIYAVRLGIWLGARAAGTICVDTFTQAFPSAFEPSAFHASNAVPSIQRSRTEHIVDFINVDIPVTPNHDAWAGAVAVASNDQVASVRAIFPRPGDPRGLHEPGLIERVGHTGAGVRIHRYPPAPGNPSRNDIWTPIACHENLLRWTFATDTSSDFDIGGVASVPEADRLLRRSILEAEGAIDELGLRAGPSQARDLLEQASAELADENLPHSFDPAHRSLLLRAAPIVWMCELALGDDSVSITRSDYQMRYAILTDLDRAARGALEAATSWSRTT